MDTKFDFQLRLNTSVQVLLTTRYFCDRDQAGQLDGTVGGIWRQLLDAGCCKTVKGSVKCKENVKFPGLTIWLIYPYGSKYLLGRYKLPPNCTLSAFRAATWIHRDVSRLWIYEWNALKINPVLDLCHTWILWVWLQKDQYRSVADSCRRISI